MSKKSKHKKKQESKLDSNTQQWATTAQSKFDTKDYEAKIFSSISAERASVDIMVTKCKLLQTSLRKEGGRC